MALRTKSHEISRYFESQCCAFCYERQRTALRQARRLTGLLWNADSSPKIHIHNITIIRLILS